VGFMQSLFGWVLAANGDSGYEHSFLIVAGLLVAALVIYAGSSEKPVTQPS